MSKGVTVLVAMNRLREAVSAFNAATGFLPYNPALLKAKTAFDQACIGIEIVSGVPQAEWRDRLEVAATHGFRSRPDCCAKLMRWLQLGDPLDDALMARLERWTVDWERMDALERAGVDRDRLLD